MNNKYNFFISYTEQDEAMAMWIVEMLESAKYTTISQVFDFKPGENFILNMHKALINAERFIAVLSENYLESLYCQSEWTSAFVKDIEQKKDNKFSTVDGQINKPSFIPVRIENINLNGLLAPIIYIDLYNLDEDAARIELLNGVTTEKRQRNGHRYPGSSKREESGINNLPQSRNPYFTGRDEILRLLSKNIKSNGLVALTQSDINLVGIGKTDIALEYAYHHMMEYKTIWWIDAGDRTAAISAYKKFALLKKIVSEDAITQDFIDAIKYWFYNNKEWLFIYDNANVDDFREWLEQLLPQQVNNGHVLITTRNRFFPKSKSLINIPIFTENEATLFLKKRTNKCGAGYSDSLASELAEELKYIPLEMEQVAAYIEQIPGVTYADCITMINKYGRDVFRKQLNIQ